MPQHLQLTRNHQHLPDQQNTKNLLLAQKKIIKKSRNPSPNQQNHEHLPPLPPNTSYEKYTFKTAVFSAPYSFNKVNK